MSRKTMGIRAFGLSLLTIAGLMAFMAASASANWLENLAEFDGNKLVEVTQHTESNLSVPAFENLEILCATIEGEDILLVGLTEEATGKAKFRNCKTWQNGVNVSANCTPAEPIEAGGKALLILHNGKNYVLFSPPAGSTKFALLKFNGLTCALPEDNTSKAPSCWNAAN